MTTPGAKPDRSAEEFRGLWRGCSVALVGGLLVGCVGAAFRAGLGWLEPRHQQFVEWALSLGWLGWALPVLLGALGAGLARLLVRPQPLAAGSGVQHVEAVMRGEAEPAPLLLVPVKFLGGLLAIGTGLVLGREGPTIQMGATIGASLARRMRCAKEALSDLQAALGGAGLAVAFNAPIGGAMFAFEEVARSFRPRLVIVTLLGTAAAITVARLILGDAPDYRVAAVTAGDVWTLIPFALMGGVLGLFGVLYNKTLIAGLDLLGKLNTWPVELRAALVGAIVGIVALFSPELVGGGDPIAQKILNGGVPITLLLVILAVRWFVGPLSYSAGTPGGIFSPLLVVGAGLGGIFAMIFNAAAPVESGVSVVAFAVVGMTAFFTGIVRAPLTGMILICEMTATTSLLVPMLAANAAAMLAATLAGNRPIYDTLRKRMLADGLKPGLPDGPAV